MRTSVLAKLKAVVTLVASLVCGAAIADETYDGVKFYECLTTGTSQYGGQRVNTGYYPNGKTIIRAKYAPKVVSSSANQALFCSRRSSTLSETYPNFTYFASLFKKPVFDYNATRYYGSTGLEATVDNVYLLEIKDGYMTVTNEDGTEFDKGGAKEAADFTTSNALFLFSTYSHYSDYSDFNNGAQVDFYYLKIYEIENDEEVLRHEYVPCKTAAGVIAIADKVTETVLYNGASTQTFTIPDWCEDVYWRDEGTDKRVLNIKEGVSYALTADDVTTLTESGRNLVVRGKGTVVSDRTLEGFAKSMTIEGGATVEMSSRIAVTGATDVAEGTLRLPEKAPFVGNRGLMGYANYDGMAWSYDKPTAEEIARDYTNYYPHGTDLLTVSSKGEGDRNYRLHGYIWNRSTTNETWSFCANFNNISWVWMDDTVIFSAVASYDAADKRYKTVPGITPGAHEITMIFAAQNNNSGPQDLNGTRAAIGIDQLGRGGTATSYYTPLIDSGDGSLLTVDNSTMVSDKFWNPTFADVSLGTDSIIDCNGHALTVGTLAGFGTVTNASTLTVAEKLVLKVADAAHAPLVVDGTLAFEDGVVVDFDSYTAQPSAEQRAAIRAGLVIARANAIAGKPVILPALRAAGYRVRKEGNTLVLTTAKGMCVSVR